jgi:hypothetical protein
MSHRLQVVLDDHQYDALAAESERTGASMAELVRQAVDTRLRLETGEHRAVRFRQALGAAAGTWRDRPDDGLAYQRRIRSGFDDRATWSPAASAASRRRLG